MPSVSFSWGTPWYADNVGYTQFVKVSPDKFLSPGMAGFGGACLLEYDPGTGSLSSSIILSVPIWPQNITNFPASAVLQDGRIFVCAGMDGVNSLPTDRVCIGTFSSGSASWVVSTPLPVSMYYPAAVTLQDGRIAVFDGGSTSVYFGTVSGNSVSWVTDSNPLPCSPYEPTATVLPDGRVLLVRDSAEMWLGTVSANTFSWQAVTFVGNPYPVNPIAGTSQPVTATVLDSGTIVFSGGYFNDINPPNYSFYDDSVVVGILSGNILTMAVSTPLPDYPQSVFSFLCKTSDDRFVHASTGYAYVADYVETLDTSFSISGVSVPDIHIQGANSAFTAQAGSSVGFSPAWKVPVVIAAASGSATSFVSNVAARQFTIAEGSASHFVSCTKEVAFTIAEGSTTAIHIKDAVERFNFAIAEGSAANLHGSQIAGTRFSARADSIFRPLPAFEWPSAIVSRCASAAAFRSAFEASGDLAEPCGSAVSFVAASRASAAFSVAAGSAVALASRPMASTYFGAACQSATAFHSRQFAGAVGALPGSSICSFVGSSSFTALPPAPNFDHMLFVTTIADSEFLLERQ